MPDTPVYKFDDLQHKVERRVIRDHLGQLSAGEYNALLDKVRELVSLVGEIQDGLLSEETLDTIKTDVLEYIKSKILIAIPDDDDDPTTNDNQSENGIDTAFGYTVEEVDSTEYPDFINIKNN